MTGESREPPLFEVLAGLAIPGWRLGVIASRQLAPGVGGYRPGQLLELAQNLEGEDHLLLATACRCHGVVHALTRRKDGTGV